MTQIKVSKASDDATTLLLEIQQILNPEVFFFFE